MNDTLRFTTAVLFAMAGLSLAAQPYGQTLRIISPANGAVVRPGHKLAVKITGRGAFSGVMLAGSPSRGGGDSSIGGNGIVAPMGKQPWVVMLDIPPGIDPQRYTIIALGSTAKKAEVESNPVEIDVEPAEIPLVSFSLPSIVMLFGSWCIGLKDDSPCFSGLQIRGTYPDGTIVSLNQSTKINFVSQAPSIARVSRDGTSLVGVSPGSTKLVVFGKYTIDVTVRDQKR